MQANEDADAEPETEQIKEWQRLEETANSEGSTSSDTLEDAADVLHVVGDIIQLIPKKTDNMQQQAYINVSGAAANSNNTGSFFEINTPQYTSYYKTSRVLSILPVQAHFNSNKYRNKKPIPSNNTYVSIEGFLEDIETDTTGRATLFHVAVDNINFLGRATPSPSIAGCLALPSTPSRSSRFKYNFNISSPASPSDASAPSATSTNVTPLSETGPSTQAGKRRK